VTSDHEQLRDSTIKAIQGAVAHQFGLSIEELRQERKQHMAMLPRQIAIYLTKQMTDASLPEIGKHFGGRHQTTVMQSIAKIHDLRLRDTNLDDLINKLMKTLLQS
jgi:chromosomal replication initiator protein